MGCGSSSEKPNGKEPRRANSMVPPMTKPELMKSLKSIQKDNKRDLEVLKFDDDDEIKSKSRNNVEILASEETERTTITRKPVKRVTIHTKNLIITKTDAKPNTHGHTSSIEIKNNEIKHNTTNKIKLISSQVIPETVRETEPNILVLQDSLKLIREHRLSILRIMKGESKANTKSIIIPKKITQEHSYVKVNFPKQGGLEFFNIKGHLSAVMNSLVQGHSLKDKSQSLKSLDNKILDCINYSIKRLKLTYKKQKITLTGQKFIDPLFPPSSESVYGLRNGQYVEKNDERRAKYMNDFPFWQDEIIWLQAKDIFEGGVYSTFANDVSVDDVQQGIVGNCYFMSSMAAQAEFPQLLYQLFKTFKIPENGCYEIGAKIEGKWQIVLVDDYFPCLKKTRKPVFAKPRGNEIWVMLLEKVWAKLNGGYLNITGGWATEVLSCFTSFPIQSLSHKRTKAEYLWSEIKYAEDNGYIMACCSQFKDEIESFGLVPGHAFTLISAKEATIKGEKIELVKLRNPWGYREWNGPWSDKSNLWTPETRDVFFQHTGDVDDGVFWMSYQDFLKFFIVTEFCKVSFPQCVRRITIGKDRIDHPNVYEIQIFKKCQMNISIIKKNYRFHRTMNKEAELITNMIIVKKTEFGTFEYVASTHEIEANPTIDIQLHHGYYLLYFHADYSHSNFDKKRKFNLYISCNVFFEIYDKGCDEEFILLKEIIHNKIIMNKDKLAEYKCTEEDEVEHLTQHKFGHTTFSFLYIKNKKHDNKLEIEIENQIENFRIIHPKFLPKTPKFTQELLEKEILLIIGHRNDYYEKYSFRFLFKFKCNPIPIHTDNSDEVSRRIETDNNELTPLLQYITSVHNIPHDEESYDFFYKMIEVDPENIIEKINSIEVAENYFIGKFPFEMAKILEFPMLNDSVEVIFRDLYDFGDSVYLGEWKTKDDFTRHGRGWFIWGDGSSYMGQIQNNIFEGMGDFFYLNGDHCTINFSNGKMHGKGIYYNKDGNVHEVEYVDGVLI